MQSETVCLFHGYTGYSYISKTITKLHTNIITITKIFRSSFVTVTNRGDIYYSYFRWHCFCLYRWSYTPCCDTILKMYLAINTNTKHKEVRGFVVVPAICQKPSEAIWSGICTLQRHEYNIVCALCRIGQVYFICEIWIWFLYVYSFNIFDHSFMLSFAYAIDYAFPASKFELQGPALLRLKPFS